VILLLPTQETSRMGPPQRYLATLVAVSLFKIAHAKYLNGDYLLQYGRIIVGLKEKLEGIL
jgi:hypothetical protein